MSPKDAYEALVANDVDYVPLESIRGRISATLALIYPPGIRSSALDSARPDSDAS
jgi:ornithine decarboxylase